jgi:hypothetical protein
VFLTYIFSVGVESLVSVHTERIEPVFGFTSGHRKPESQAKSDASKPEFQAKSDVAVSNTTETQSGKEGAKGDVRTETVPQLITW